MLLTLLSSVSFGSTLLTENFGNIQSSGCTSKWTGKCEQSTGAFGQNSKLSLAYDDNSPTNYGVVIQGSSAAYPNGVQKTYSGSMPSEVLLEARGETFDDDIDIGLRLVFKDGSGELIDDVVGPWTIDKGSFNMTLAAVVPAGTASIDLQFGAIGSGKSVWLDQLHLSDAPEHPYGSPSSASECVAAVTAECAGKPCGEICGTDICQDCPVDKRVAFCFPRWEPSTSTCFVEVRCLCLRGNSVVEPVSI